MSVINCEIPLSDEHQLIIWYEYKLENLTVRPAQVDMQSTS